MKNKVDEVLITLLRAKDNIVNNTDLNITNKNSYKQIINGLDNLIVDYTLNNKMTNKEILDCALSIYDRKKPNKFIDKLKSLKSNLSISKIVNKVKNKVVENRKKKETKKRYEKEITDLVKARLKTMIDEDRKMQQEKKGTKTEEKTFSKNDMSMDKEVKIPLYDKNTAEKLISTKKPNLFIFRDDENYLVYRREKDPYPNPFDKNKIIDKFQLAKFNNFSQAIICAIDKDLYPDTIKKDFDKIKNNYGNLASYVIDKSNTNYNFDIENTKKF